MKIDHFSGEIIPVTKLKILDFAGTMNQKETYHKINQHPPEVEEDITLSPLNALDTTSLGLCVRCFCFQIQN